MKLKGFLMVVGVVLALGVAGLAGYNAFKPLQEKLGLADAEFDDNASDVFGTKTATSTVGVNFRVTASGGQSATSTAVSKIEGHTSLVVYTIKTITASSSANLRWEFEGSQDYGCDTTATSGGNEPLVSEINWFSAGDHLANKAHTTSFGTATSTQSFVWNNPMNGSGQEVILENLNYKCLRMSMSGSSTVAWVQIATKNLSSSN